MNMQLLALVNRPWPLTAMLRLLGVSPIGEHSRPILRVPGSGAWLVNMTLPFMNLQLAGWLFYLLLMSRCLSLLGRCRMSFRLTQL